MKRKLLNVNNRLPMVKLTVKPITLTIVVLFLMLVVAFPPSAQAQNFSQTPLVSRGNYLNPLAVQEPSLYSLSIFWLPDFLAQIDKMPTGSQLNGFMKTSYQWGIQTGKQFLGLLLAYKLVSVLFKK